MRIIIASLAAALLFAGSACAIETPLTRTIKDKVESLGLGPHEITIDEFAGDIIGLSGTVGSDSDRRAVESMAAATPGVKEVRSRLLVSQAALGGEGSLLAEQVKARILAEPSIYNMQLQVSDRNGNVLLSGRVDNLGDRQKIERIARSLPGVVSVENRLTYPAPEPDGQIENRVRQTLASDPSINMQGVELSVRNGVVHLSGSKSNHREIDRILANVLMIDGVKNVRSEVKIGGKEYMSEAPVDYRARFGPESD